MNKQLRAKVISQLEKQLVKEYSKLVYDTYADKECWERINDIEDQLDRLREVEENKWYDRIDINQLISAGVGLTSILLILKYEKIDVLTTKALPLAQKLIGK